MLYKPVIKKYNKYRGKKETAMKALSSIPIQILDVQKGFFFYCDQDYTPPKNIITEADRVFPYKSVEIVTKDTADLLKRGAAGILTKFDNGEEIVTITGMGDILSPALFLYAIH